MTTHDEGTGLGGRAEQRSVVYCLIPPDLAPRLHDLLRRHFADDPSVEVVVERRRGERRSRKDRRGPGGKPRGAKERRRVRSTTGRRVGERRAPLVPIAEPPPLPRRARRYADRIAFVERLEPATPHSEDLDTARLVTDFQAGDPDAFATLYTRYFERVYSYLRVLLRDPHEAEDATQQVFVQAFEALPRYERRRQPFRSWLFAIVRNQAINRLRKLGRVDVLDPAEIARQAERLANGESDLELGALEWINDTDLLILVERLPAPQRQVLMMRYLLDLSAIEIAAAMDRSPDDVRMLQHRAQRFLRDRLTALGRSPARAKPPPMLRRTREATVLRARRFSIR